MTISIITAFDQNRVIGNKGDLPWKIPGDLKYFKETTMGKPVIMGRKTYESIGKPLPGRVNAVVSRNRIDHPEVIHFYSLQAALKTAKTAPDEYFVIGGSKVYEAALSMADKLFLTYVDYAFEGDTYFPPIDYDEWLLHSEKCSIVGGVVKNEAIKVCYAEFWRKK